MSFTITRTPLTPPAASSSSNDAHTLETPQGDSEISHEISSAENFWPLDALMVPPFGWTMDMLTQFPEFTPEEWFAMYPPSASLLSAPTPPPSGSDYTFPQTGASDEEINQCPVLCPDDVFERLKEAPDSCAQLMEILKVYDETFSTTYDPVIESLGTWSMESGFDTPKAEGVEEPPQTLAEESPSTSPDEDHSS